MDDGGDLMSKKEEKENVNGAYRTTSETGFQISFKNGIMVSVQFGPMTYSKSGLHVFSVGSLYRHDFRIGNIHQSNVRESEDAEITVVKNGEFITKQCIYDIYGYKIDNDFIGWMSTDEFADIIAWCKEQEDIDT
jgi:hypothetical protein